jgi:hypothetical protein
MEGYTSYDITGCSFDEFVDFLFLHEVVPSPGNGSKSEPWYWNAIVTFEPVAVTRHYIRLFSEPEFLLRRFTREQLEQGFWAIQGCNIECSAAEIMWSREVPSEQREICVRAMFHLFEKLFSLDSLHTAAHMWWDSLAYDWHCGNRERSKGGEDEHMQDIIFETLKDILDLSAEECQAAALHGLGHLHHPGTADLIACYLERNPDIPAELREYAEAAAKFEIM